MGEQLKPDSKVEIYWGLSVVFQENGNEKHPLQIKMLNISYSYQGTLSDIEQQNVVMKTLSFLFIVFHFLPMLAFNWMFVFP